MCHKLGRFLHRLGPSAPSHSESAAPSQPFALFMRACSKGNGPFTSHVKNHHPTRTASAQILRRFCASQSQAAGGGAREACTVVFWKHSKSIGSIDWLVSLTDLHQTVATTRMKVRPKSNQKSCLENVPCVLIQQVQGQNLACTCNLNEHLKLVLS